MAAPQAPTIGGKKESVTLDQTVFGERFHEALVHETVRAELAARRRGSASTLTRAEVAMTGAKAWRQKGTGRARHGSIRSPIWVGGGVVFGPRPRDHSVRVNKKMKKAALRAALADKANGGRIWVLAGLDEPRTKAAAACLEAAGIDGRVLIVVDPGAEDDMLVDRAFRNLPRSAFSLVGALAAYDVVVADHVLFTASAFDRFVERTQVKEATAT